jgi:hypothetical protein
MKSIHHARLLRAAVIAILLTLTGGAVAAPAQAAAYRYWGYFHLTKGAWAFASTGPAQVIPADGAVDGWRFAVADESSIRTPRATPTFAALCSRTAVTAGSKRVGLVLDFGRPADSADGATPPPAQAVCVTAPLKASGNDILVAGGATLRLEKALNCAIDGWPATGCGDSVAHVSAAAASADTAITIAAPKAKAAASSARKSAATSSASSPGLALGVAGVIALIAVLGFAAWRRGREATDD